MTVFTEGQHTGEFLLSEGNGDISRESGTLKSGEVVTDGQLLQLSGTKLIEAVGDLATDESLQVAIEGVVIGDHDASDGDVEGVPYIARLATVKDAAITYPTGEATDSDDATVKAACVASMKELNIIPR